MNTSSDSSAATSGEANSHSPSAFPELPERFDVLPEIPGGWSAQEFHVGSQTLRLMRPTNPDLFLDDADVQKENARNDYMPYWAFLWPSAVKMAAAVQNPEWEAGTEVLELGAGIGLVGLAALARGDRVVFSDYDATALHLCQYNAHLNGLGVPETIKLDWRDVPNRTFPVLIGCEITYDATLHEPLLILIGKMLAPGGVCWLGDPGRFQGPFFYEAAIRHGFRVRIQDEFGNEHSAPLSNQFQILKLDRSSPSVVPR